VNKSVSRSAVAMWIGIELLVISWTYPPWRGAPYSDGEAWHFVLPGFHFVFFKYGDLFKNTNFSPQIDVKRLAEVDISIIAITAGAMIALRKSHSHNAVNNAQSSSNG